jgi:hypothetical protein
MVDSEYKESVFDKHKMLSKMNDMVIPDAYLWVDSKSGVPKSISFLIWQYYPKWSWKAGGENIEVAQFGRLKLYQMQKFEEIQNMKVSGSDSICETHYT